MDKIARKWKTQCSRSLRPVYLLNLLNRTTRRQKNTPWHFIPMKTWLKLSTFPTISLRNLVQEKSCTDPFFFFSQWQVENQKKKKVQMLFLCVLAHWKVCNWNFTQINLYELHLDRQQVYCQRCCWEKGQGRRLNVKNINIIIINISYILYFFFLLIVILANTNAKPDSFRENNKTMALTAQHDYSEHSTLYNLKTVLS